ncbi:MAG: flavin reductase family protein [Gammaproteobacteria bacterium]
MFFRPGVTDHGLPHNPFMSLVVPRPIGWVSTLGPAGTVNVAPYSFFNIVSVAPYYVMFSSAGHKHSLSNARDRGEFVCNLAGYDLREAVNVTSTDVPAEISEAELAGLALEPSQTVAVPRVAAAKAHLECRTWKLVDLPAGKRPELAYTIVIGEVTGIHVHDEVIRDGRVDLGAIRPIARLGYDDYSVVDQIFSMPRPR